MATKKTTKAPAQPNVSTAPATPAAPAPAPASPPAATPSGGPTALVTTTANGSNHGTKVDLEATYQALISGLIALYESTDTFALKSGTVTRDALVASFNGFVVAAEQTKADNLAWRQSVQAEREVEQTVRPMRQAVKGIAAAKFGKDGAALRQLGFNPVSTPKKTVATKSAAIAKGKATRVARHTMGSKQRLEITAGASAAAAPVSPGAPTPPAPAPAPVPAAPRPAGS